MTKFICVELDRDDSSDSMTLTILMILINFDLTDISLFTQVFS